MNFDKMEQHAFFYEEAHLLLLVSNRSRKFLFLIQGMDEQTLMLEDPGELFENQVRDAIDAIFFVELIEQDRPPKNLILGAFFPVDDQEYGAYYERDGKDNTIYFLQAIGQGESKTLEAVDDPSEYQKIADVFMSRYESLL